MMDGGSRGGRAKRQRSNSGAGKGVKAVLAAGSKGTVHTSAPPGGIRAGRPRPARQAGRCTPPPLPGAPLQRVLCGPKGPVSCLERPLWREWILSRAWRRVSSPGAALLVGTPSAVPQCGRGLYVGRKARLAAGIPCPTSRQHGYQYHPDLEPGKFPRGGPAQGHPHPFRCAGMGVGCAAGGPLRRFDPGGPQTGEPQIRERSTYRWRFPGKCLRPPTSGGTDRRGPWTTNPPGWTGWWYWSQRRP